MKLLHEFREFAVKGNVVDLAVGVIIGAAFAKIVDSLVSDVIMPFVGAVFGKLDFSSYFMTLGPVPAGTGPSRVKWLEKSSPPKILPTTGMMISSVKLATILAKAAPMITATARSRTFPLATKARKSWSMASPF